MTAATRTLTTTKQNAANAIWLAALKRETVLQRCRVRDRKLCDNK